MKFDLGDLIAAGAVVASAVGFYFVGRYHEDYLNEKRTAQPEAEPTPEAASEEPKAE